MQAVQLPYYSTYSTLYWMQNLSGMPIHPNRAGLTPFRRLIAMSRKPLKSYRQDEKHLPPQFPAERMVKVQPRLLNPLEIQNPYLAITDFSCFAMRARAACCAGSLSVNRAPVSPSRKSTSVSSASSDSRM